MLNQLILVGRIVAIENKNDENAIVTIAVNRSFKNENGEYETDFIDCDLHGVIAKNTIEYCKKGDVIGVKGRIQTSIHVNEIGEKEKNTKIVAEKITFLSSKKESEEEKDEL